MLVRYLSTDIHYSLAEGKAAYDLDLTEGLRFERRTFHSLFATKDQKEGEKHDLTEIKQPLITAMEGMSAFAEKRKAIFTHS